MIAGHAQRLEILIPPSLPRMERTRSEPQIGGSYVRHHITAGEASAIVAGVATVELGADIPSGAHHVRQALLLLRWCRIQRWRPHVYAAGSDTWSWWQRPRMDF